LDGNLRSGAIDDWELDDEDISANWIWRFDFPNKWIICDGNDTSVVGGGHGRTRGEELDVLNDIAPGVELDVLDFFSYSQIKDDGALECFVDPVDVPVNMLMSRVNLVDVTVG
jgi:hypothetical protein